MDRKQLLSELTRIKIAFDNRNKTLNDVIYISSKKDYEKYCTKLTLPEKPVAPICPDNASDRNLTISGISDFEEYKQRKQKISLGDKTRPSNRILPIILIYSGLFLFSLSLVMIGNDKSGIEWFSALLTPNLIMTIGYYFLFHSTWIFLLVLVVKYLFGKLKSQIELKKEYNRYKESSEQSNADKLLKKQKAEKVYNEYLILKAKYDEELQNYNEQVSLLQEMHKKELERVENEIDERNLKLKIKAERDFNDAMKSVKIEYPPKYYRFVDEVITIIRDLRADTLKEAINVCLADRHRADMIYIQEQQARVQKEHEKELERQKLEFEEKLEEERLYRTKVLNEERRLHEEELSIKKTLEEAQRQYKRKEEDRIEKIQRECIKCRHYYDCSFKYVLTDICPKFER